MSPVAVLPHATEGTDDFDFDVSISVAPFASSEPTNGFSNWKSCQSTCCSAQNCGSGGGFTTYGCGSSCC